MIKNYEEYLKEIKLLNKASDAYYIDSKPIMIDSEFDSRLKNVEEYESLNPDDINIDSPTQNVGSDLSQGFKKITHDIPMLSISKVFEYSDLEKWINETNKKINLGAEYITETKIDGAGLSVKYRNGKLYQAISRGRNGVGDDVTENAKVISGIPHTIPILTDIEIRGEVIIYEKDFNELNAECEKNGEELHSNPRNSASGGMKSKDPQDAKARKLSFIAYLIVNGSQEKYHGWDLINLKKWNFTVPVYLNSNSFQDIKDFCEKIYKEKSSLGYDIDGMIIKLNNKPMYKQLGGTKTSPNYLKAYKFPAEEKIGILSSVSFELGRTGIICPVAHFDIGIHLAGTTVKKSTLHNFDEIQRLGIAIGDEVIVCKRGEIIPKVMRLHKQGSKRILIVPPTNCPVCNGLVRQNKGEVAYKCQNPNCKSKLYGAFEKFCGKDGMDMRGIASSTLEQIIDAGLVQSFDQLYDLKEKDLIGLERFGTSKAKNVISAIQGSKQAGLKRLLIGLGIENVGSGTSGDLADHFKSIDQIMSASAEDYQKVSGIKEVAYTIRSYFNDPKNILLINKLKQHNVIMTTPISKGNNMATKRNLTGFSFVVTGTCSMTREDMHHLIERNGGTIQKAVSRNTSYLVLGEDVGQVKITKAENLGVKMLDEESLRALINQ